MPNATETRADTTIRLTRSAMLVRQIARMHYDGEELPDGTIANVSDDDCAETLSRLIQEARRIQSLTA